MSVHLKTHDEWVHIGSVAVDSGTVMIADPCYAGDMAKQVVALFDSDPGSVGQTEAWGFEGRQEGGVAGVLSGTAYGDGCYPVYARYRGKTIIALEINFDPDGVLAMLEAVQDE